MNSNEAIKILYESASKLLGEVEAKSTVSRVLFIVLDDLQQEGLTVTDKLIASRVMKFAEDFSEVVSKQVA